MTAASFLRIRSTVGFSFLQSLIPEFRNRIYCIATMSTSWPDSKQGVTDPLDPTLSDFLNFDILDQLDPVNPQFDPTPDTTLPSNATIDWSYGIDPLSCLLPDLDIFAIESPPESNSSSGLLTDEQSLKDTVSQLVARIDKMERSMAAMKAIETMQAQLEENIRNIGQRLMKVEEEKQVHDAEYAEPLSIKHFTIPLIM